MLKSIALWVLVIASLLAAIAAHMRIRDVEKGLALQRLILEDIQKSDCRNHWNDSESTLIRIRPSSVRAMLG
jgi:hypothetical protein